jgi:hypothetical protein
MLSANSIAHLSLQEFHIFLVKRDLYQQFKLQQFFKTIRLKLIQLGL